MIKVAIRQIKSRPNTIVMLESKAKAADYSYAMEITPQGGMVL